MRRFNLLCSAALISASLLNCTKATKGDDESTGSTFFVNAVHGSGSVNLSRKAVWKIPESATFTFQACLTTRTTHKDLYNQEFAVEVPGSREVFPVKTNNNGCFNWQERIAYNHFAGQSGWVTLERDVIGRGASTGKVRVKVPVNPWAEGDKSRDHGVDSVVFLSQGEAKFIPSLIFGGDQAARALSGEVQGPSRLIVQNVRIKSIPEGEDGKWVALMVEMTMEPVVQSLNANGETVYEEIRDGDFDLMTLACLGRRDEAATELAAAWAVPIADEEDAKILRGDLTSEPWYGLPVPTPATTARPS